MSKVVVLHTDATETVSTPLHG